MWVEDNYFEIYKRVSVFEIEGMLRLSDTSKVLGPDGLSGCFYKHYWTIMKGDVATIKQFSNIGHLLR